MKKNIFFLFFSFISILSRGDLGADAIPQIEVTCEPEGTECICNGSQSSPKIQIHLPPPNP
jgi:hypothetical protein